MHERGLAFLLRLFVRVLGGAVCGVRVRNAARLVRGSADELLLEVLWAEDGDLGEEELALYAVGVCVVEHGPYRNLVAKQALIRACGCVA